MKKIEANRYPHSAALFAFCREALEIRYEGNVKVIDQDVGSILGYDPADCSHWKKGKKNIRSLTTIRTISNHLNVDERLLVDLVAGRIEVEEAVFEYKGYGKFHFSAKQIETFKKSYFANPEKYSDGRRTFEDLFDINRPLIQKLSQQLLEKGNFKEAPVFVPELFQASGSIQLEIVDQGEPIEVLTGEKVRIKNDVRRPYLRFLALRELYKSLIAEQAEYVSLRDRPKNVEDVQANLFAGLTLVPGFMLRDELKEIDHSFDIVEQLAATFWVSKALMNQRLRDYIENQG